MLDGPPPPYEPRMSAIVRFLNSMLPALVVPSKQLRPDVKYVERIMTATHDIRLCEDIFNNWSAHLDKITSEKPDERERKVRHHLAGLRESATRCSEATNEILRSHTHFAYMMAWRIDRASRSWFKGLKFDTDTTRLANDIARASRSLSQNVMKLQDDLASFVSDLEKIKVKKKRSIARRIFGWLKHLFNAVGGIFALGSIIGPLLHAVAPGVGLGLSVASVLFKATAELCRRASEKRDWENIEHVLLFLKETIPREAKNAQQALVQFDEALLIMGLEERMIKTGRRVALSGPDSAAIAKEWMKIAEKYRSLLPLEENLVGRPEDSLVFAIVQSVPGLQICTQFLTFLKRW